ncbi:MAG TPA: rhomboid family intramembrane serine protease [Flavobacteriales bacterium]|nr:rhomboid family intramembrane serine protease [Flavobacteriales bacterium]
MEAPVTTVILVITCLVSIAAFSDHRLFTALLFEPYVMNARKQWYRFITHAFIHSGWPHLFVNMFVLHMFGKNVEFLLPMVTHRSPTFAFILLYVGGILFSSLPSYKRHLHDPNYRAVGASGAVSAVLFAQILMLPTSPVRIMFIPIDIPSWIFGIIYLWYSWYMDKRGGDNVAHDAHFFGAVFGIAYMTLLEPSLLFHIGAFQDSLPL